MLALLFLIVAIINVTHGSIGWGVTFMILSHIELMTIKVRNNI
jgi:hypothetical protein